MLKIRIEKNKKSIGDFSLCNVGRYGNELQEFIFIGKEQLKAHKAKIRAIEKVNMAVVAKEAALEDAQVLADILLDAEVKLGEMLEKIDKSASKLKGKDRGSKGGTTKKTLPPTT